MCNARLSLTLLWDRSTASPFLSAGRAWLPAQSLYLLPSRNSSAFFPDPFHQQCKVLTSAVMSYIGACCNGSIYGLTISFLSLWVLVIRQEFLAAFDTDSKSSACFQGHPWCEFVSALSVSHSQVRQAPLLGYMFYKHTCTWSSWLLTGTLYYNSSRLVFAGFFFF